MAAQSPADSDHDSDRDSALGDERALSDTQSLSSSVMAYPWENGRRYHAYCAGTYLYPNDEEEQDRLDLQHAMFTKLLGGQLHLAPLCAPGRVLDLGTGTGIWAIDFADQHPESIVLGVDLSPIQPTLVPPNCSFEVCNYDDLWSFEHQFDYIRARDIGTSITFPHTFFRQVWDNLAPGAWFEIQDVLLPRADDDTIPHGGAYATWIDDYDEALKTAGRNPSLPDEYQERLLAIGFTNVCKVTFKLPQNRWPKDKRLKLLGTFNHVNTWHGLEAMSLRLFTQYLGRPFPAVQGQLEEVKRELGDRDMHAYWPVVVVYAQKPTHG